MYLCYALFGKMFAICFCYTVLIYNLVELFKTLQIDSLL